MSQQPDSRNKLPSRSPASGAESEGDRLAPRGNARGEPKSRPVEIGGRNGPDPTRYGDWEKDGRCIDF